MVFLSLVLGFFKKDLFSIFLLPFKATFNLERECDRIHESTNTNYYERFFNQFNSFVGLGWWWKYFFVFSFMPIFICIFFLGLDEKECKQVWDHIECKTESDQTQPNSRMTCQMIVVLTIGSPNLYNNESTKYLGV